MLRSKQITDYVEVQIKNLRPGAKLPIDIHLYFSSNRHILVWRKCGEELSDAFLKKYRLRGMQQVWIHRDDLETWLHYLKKEGIEIEASAATPTPEAIAAAATPTPLPDKPTVPVKPEIRTEEGRNITGMMEDVEMSDRHRTALVARAARNVLIESAEPLDPAFRNEGMAHAREVVRDILDSALKTSSREIRDLINEVWELSSLDPGLDHAVNVAALAVLFAMAFGRISQELTIDIALAALLHDVGVTQVPAQVVRIPWNDQQPQEVKAYSRHVDEGLRLLDELAPGLPPRIRPLIQQHHEKFDGSGYPLQLQGFQIGDIAQLISMADAVESMGSGQWDGEVRTLTETFDRLESLEKSRTFPEYFNPEVFAAVIRWIRDPKSLASKAKSMDIVQATGHERMRVNKS